MGAEVSSGGGEMFCWADEEGRGHGGDILLVCHLRVLRRISLAYSRILKIDEHRMPVREVIKRT